MAFDLGSAEDSQSRRLQRALAAGYDTAPSYGRQLFARYTEDIGATILKKESFAEDLVSFLETAGNDFDRPAILSCGRISGSLAIELHWDKDVLKATVELEQAALRHYGYTPGVSESARKTRFSHRVRTS